MTTPYARTTAAAVIAFALASASFAHAQSSSPGSGGLLGDLFGRGQSNNAEPRTSDADLVVRMERLENHIRQLTGTIEQLQFRNQQLEQALRKMHEDNEYRFQQLGAKPSPTPPTAQLPATPRPSPSAAPPSVPQSGRRSDVFDPRANPNAPGAPRTLGTGMTIAGAEPGTRDDTPPVGIAGGREAGAPLDLSTLAQPDAPGQAPGLPGVRDPGSGLPAPPPRNTSATGVVASVQAPSQSPKDEYDLAYGYMLRKDYALAETAFRNFLKQHPTDRRVADATYWLGESMYQRQRYRDAAESFLAVTTKHEKSGKAPDSLYRLGQALAALGENEAACAALGEVGRKYPRASANVKQGVEREQQRVRC